MIVPLISLAASAYGIKQLAGQQQNITLAEAKYLNSLASSQTARIFNALEAAPSTYFEYRQFINSLPEICKIMQSGETYQQKMSQLPPLAAYIYSLFHQDATLDYQLSQQCAAVLGDVSKINTLLSSIVSFEKGISTSVLPNTASMGGQYTMYNGVAVPTYTKASIPNVAAAGSLCYQPAYGKATFNISVVSGSEAVLLTQTSGDWQVANNNAGITGLTSYITDKLGALLAGIFLEIKSGGAPAFHGVNGYEQNFFITMQTKNLPFFFFMEGVHREFALDTAHISVPYIVCCAGQTIGSSYTLNTGDCIIGAPGTRNIALCVDEANMLAPVAWNYIPNLCVANYTAQISAYWANTTFAFNSDGTPVVQTNATAKVFNQPEGLSVVTYAAPWFSNQLVLTAPNLDGSYVSSGLSQFLCTSPIFQWTGTPLSVKGAACY